MKAFEYAAPTSVEDAVKLLGGPDAAALSGGTDLISRMKDYVTSPDAGGLPQGHQGARRDLRRPQAAGLTIGAGTRLADVVANNGDPASPTRALAGDPRGRHAADPQHGDRRRQPAPAPPLLVLPRRQRPARP